MTPFISNDNSSIKEDIKTYEEKRKIGENAN